jgi:hypothetical protein
VEHRVELLKWLPGSTQRLDGSYQGALDVQYRGIRQGNTVVSSPEPQSESPSPLCVTSTGCIWRRQTLEPIAGNQRNHCAVCHQSLCGIEDKVARVIPLDRSCELGIFDQSDRLDQRKPIGCLHEITVLRNENERHSIRRRE